MPSSRASAPTIQRPTPESSPASSGRRRFRSAARRRTPPGTPRGRANAWPIAARSAARPAPPHPPSPAQPRPTQVSSGPPLGDGRSSPWDPGHEVLQHRCFTYEPIRASYRKEIRWLCMRTPTESPPVSGQAAGAKSPHEVAGAGSRGAPFALAGSAPGSRVGALTGRIDLPPQPSGGRGFLPIWSSRRLYPEPGPPSPLL